MPQRNDPLETYNFIVEIDGVTVAGFKELSGIESRIEVVEYREGGESYLPVRKLPGKVTYQNLVLKTGITQDRTLYDWHLAWVKRDPTATRKAVKVTLMDGAGQAQLTWTFREAWPVAYLGPCFNAEANLVAIQTIELAHEGIDLA
jgi:phage tail-like protein